MCAKYGRCKATNSNVIEMIIIATNHRLFMQYLETTIWKETSDKYSLD